MFVFRVTPTRSELWWMLMWREVKVAWILLWLFGLRSHCEKNNNKIPCDFCCSHCYERKNPRYDQKTSDWGHFCLQSVCSLSLVQNKLSGDLCGLKRFKYVAHLSTSQLGRFHLWLYIIMLINGKNTTGCIQILLLWLPAVFLNSVQTVKHIFVTYCTILTDTCQKK